MHETFPVGRQMHPSAYDEALTSKVPGVLMQAPDVAEPYERSPTVNSGPLRIFVTPKPCRESEIVL